MPRHRNKAEHPLKKITRWSLWSACAWMLLMLGVHLLLPHFINARSVKDRIIAAAQGALSGRVDFGTLRLNLLPLPSVLLSHVQLQVQNRLDVSAEAVSVYPQIWPLLIGQIRVRSATIQSPVIEIQLPSGPHSEGALAGGPPSLDNTAIQSALSRLPGGIRLWIRHGEVNLLRQGRTVAHFEGLDVKVDNEAQRLRLHIQGRSNLAADFEAEAELEEASLDLKGQADVDALDPMALKTALAPGKSTLMADAAVNAHLTFESNGLHDLRCAFSAGAPAVTVTRAADETRLWEVQLEGGLYLTKQGIQASLSQLKIATPRLNLSGALDWTYAAASRPGNLHLSLEASDSDATGWRTAMLALAPDLAQWKLFEVVQGGTLERLVYDAAGPSWQSIGETANMKISGVAADAMIHVPGVDLDLTRANGDWQLTGGVLKVEGAAARLGLSKASGGRLSLGLIGENHPIGLSVDLDADLAQLPPILKRVLPEESPARKELERVQSLQGSARGRLLLSGTLEEMKVAVHARDIHLQAESDQLPSPVVVQNGQCLYDDQGVTLKAIQAGMGDTRVTTLDGRIAFNEAWSAQLTVTGTIAERELQWAHDRFKLPPAFKPNGPIAVKGLKLFRQPDGRLGLDGALGFPGDLRVGIQLTVAGASFDLSRLTLVDGRSDARIAVHRDAGQKIWDADFEGHLEGSTLLKIWRQGPQQSGWLKGRLAVHLPLTHPDRSTLQGTLAAGDLMVPLGALGTVRIHHTDLACGERKLAIKALDLSWNLQQLSVTGDILFADQTPHLNLSVSTDVLDVGEIEKTLQNRKADGADAKPDTRPFKIPVTGNIHLKAGRLLYGVHRWEPLQATVQLAPDQVNVAVSEANICGIATPGTLRWTPRGVWLALSPTAVNQTLQVSMGCLVGDQTTERLEGTFNVSGKITTSGENSETLLKRMQGWIKFNAANGRVSNAGDVGLLTNILSYLRINKLITGDVPDLKKRDFKYKSILLDLQIHDGQVDFKQADVRSETLNLVAEGSIDLTTQRLALTVLVSPLTGLDTLVRNIPVVGKILKGTLIAIPVGVRGPLSDPSVIPLSPLAVGDRLKGILERTLEAPFQLVEPLFQSNSKSDAASDEEKKTDSQ